ncbi:MAG: glycosyltransferase family 4 protein [Tannerellaceae bacterium]|jgi:glycosyltransferase involved in cell wall biosynthesis|nr:glycosyltransferase family 4 protein [Tannerellaceae bacterium]
MNKSITFLLPRTGEIPIGGFKVVYEYANRLVRDGYSVNIIYGIVARPISNIMLKCAYYFLRFFRWVKYLYYRNYTPDSWFKTDERVKHILKYSLSEKGMPETDCYVATAWNTAVWLNKYHIPTKRKFYFIQHFEDWAGPYNAVLDTWKMNLTKIVIAPWLQKIADDLCEKSYLIENGFDEKKFHITIPVEKKNKYSAVMLWHDLPFKSCRMGLKALERVKNKHPQFKAVFFGTPDKPKDLPAWIEYHKVPSAEKHLNIYNASAIFVGTSSSEGWGLTVGEAMLCGCAVACTDNEGYAIVAHDEKTALLSQIGDAVALSKNIMRLIEDDSLRIKIAMAGNLLIKNYTWERSYKKFASLLSQEF